MNFMKVMKPRNATMVAAAFLVAGGVFAANTSNVWSTFEWWGGIWSQDCEYYMLNNVYDWFDENGERTAPNGAWQGIWFTDQDNWEAHWDLNGAGPSFPGVTYGHWPWDDKVTAHSELPKPLSELGNYYMEWTFDNFNDYDDEWNAAVEIWVHGSGVIGDYGDDGLWEGDFSNITCDIMIEPNDTVTQYQGDSVGTFPTSDGVLYDVFVQYPDRPYEIVHFKRRERQDSTGKLPLHEFFDYCVANGYASSSDWLGSINPAIEPFSGTGGYRTTNFYIQRERYDAEELESTTEPSDLWNQSVEIGDANFGRVNEFAPRGPGDKLTYKVYVFEAGEYEISTRVLKAPERGRFSLRVDGGPRIGRSLNLYRSSPKLITVKHGNAYLARGEHNFTYQSVGTRTSSYHGSFDYIQLRRVD